MKIYYYHNGEQEVGPFSIEDLQNLDIKPETPIWYEGLEQWTIAGKIKELEPLFKNKVSPPPFVAKKKSGINPNYLVFGLLAFLAILYFAKQQWAIRTYTEKFEEQTLDPTQDSIMNEIMKLMEPIPEPPVVAFNVTQHNKKILKELVKNCNLQGNKKQLVKSCDYTHKDVRNLAVSIAGQHEGDFNLGQICDIFDHCYKNWKYVNDPAQQEIIELASLSIKNGFNGDCDDFAVLTTSLLLAIGGEARINYAYTNEKGHAFTEVNLGKTNKKEIEAYLQARYKSQIEENTIWAREDNFGNYWLNLDWFATYPGGKYIDYTNGTSFYILQKYCEDF